MSTLVYLLRRDLRLADNTIFHALAKQHGFSSLLPLYILSPTQVEVSGFLQKGANSPYPECRSRVGNFWRCGPQRATFLSEALFDLKKSLKEKNSDLEIRVGPMHDVVKEVLDSELDVGAVWISRDFGIEEMAEERKIEKAVSQAKRSVQWKVWESEDMLIHDADMSTKPSELSDVFTQFRKTVEPLRDNIRQPVPAPAKLPPMPTSIPPQSSPFAVPSDLDAFVAAFIAPLSYVLKMDYPEKAKSAHPFKGGESTAHQRVQHLVSSGSMTSYKDTRNGMLGTDFSTKLSAWLAMGCISARQINEYLVAFEDGKDQKSSHAPGFGKGENKGTAAVRFELLWRDYMRLCMRKYGSSLYSIHGFQQHSSKKPYQHEWKSADESKEAFERWRNGTTGTGLIDASMRELFLTGYTSNRARQNCASYLAKWLNIDWRIGAEWYESTLIDYDAASNWGNWQYVAGVGNDPRDVGTGGRRFNPVKQSFDYDKEGDYVRTWVSEVRDIKEVAIVFQGWKVEEKKLLQKENHETVDNLRAVEWVKNPLVKIPWDKRGQRESGRPSRGRGKGLGPKNNRPRAPNPAS